MKRFDWYTEIHRLDAEADCRRITEILTTHEFPWDIEQALSLALYRTYAVPSIGQLLAETREFLDRTQRRSDDTASSSPRSCGTVSNRDGGAMRCGA